MSVQSLQSSVQRAHGEIASLQTKLSDLSRKEAEKGDRLARAQGGLSSVTSASALQGKLREIASLQKEIAGIQKDKAGVNKRIGDKTRELHKYQQNLAKEEEQERKRIIEAEKKRQREATEFQSKLKRELESHRAVPVAFQDSFYPRPAQILPKSHDLFISHASEDKDEFVRPLAEALQRLGVAVWFDEFQLKVGDSLRRSIDAGLAGSRFGVVVLSGAFFAKNWPQYELDGLVAREVQGSKVILPIWHRVTKDEVLQYSPTLADRVALNSSMKSIVEIAQDLAEVVGPSSNPNIEAPAPQDPTN